MLFACVILISASPRPVVYSDTQNNTAMREMQNLLQSLRYESNNHEQEIRIFDEKLKNLDTIIESLREESDQVNLSNKNQIKSQSTAMSEKLSAQEALAQGLISDMKQFKTHAQEVDASFVAIHKKIGALETAVAQINDNIKHMQEAIYTMTDALQGKDVSDKKSGTAASPKNQSNVYIVKSGDSLEKIAKKHQTTVQAIRDLNGLCNDRIIVGKALQLPEK